MHPTIRETIEGDRLILRANNAMRHELAAAYKGNAPGISLNGYAAAEMLLCEYGYNGANGGLAFLPPERLPEAMTEMPLLADWCINDDDSTTVWGKVYGFPGYCVTDPWARLRDTGRVEFVCVADYGDGAVIPPVMSEPWREINATAYDRCLENWSPTYTTPTV